MDCVERGLVTLRLMRANDIFCRFLGYVLGTVGLPLSSLDLQCSHGSIGGSSNCRLATVVTVISDCYLECHIFIFLSINDVKNIKRIGNGACQSKNGFGMAS